MSLEQPNVSDESSGNVDSDKALSDFRANLEDKASEGDSVAQENIQEFDRLSEA